MKKNKEFNNKEIFHETNPDLVLKRLNRFYGKVATMQNNLIISRILGKKILDIGSGYGYLLKQLTEQNFDALGIELATKEIEFSRKWWNVEVINCSAYDLESLKKNFDTIILRDVVFHLDIDKVIKEINKVTNKRVVVFMGNTGWLLKTVKWLLRHKEHNIKSVNDYIKIFAVYGYCCKEIIYSDFIAFPLSGGYISYSFVPNIYWLQQLLIFIERKISNLFRLIKIDKWFAYRVMLVFDKKK